MHLQPEARARLIIDQIFLGLLIALGENHVKSFVFLEMRIASKGEIIEIHHDAYKTILTGSVDYAVLTVIPDESTPGDNKADPTSGKVCIKNNMIFTNKVVRLFVC